MIKRSVIKRPAHWERSPRLSRVKWCHGKSSWRGGNCEGLSVAGLDADATSVVRAELPGGAVGSALLSWELVTVLSPPVGGLSRTLSGNSIGGRESGGYFSGFVQIVGGLANSALIAVSDFVRYRTTRCQRLGYLQRARKRRHRQTGRLRHRFQPGSSLRFGGLGLDARSSHRDCPRATKCCLCAANSTQSCYPHVVGVDLGDSKSLSKLAG